MRERFLSILRVGEYASATQSETERFFIDLGIAFLWDLGGNNAMHYSDGPSKCGFFGHSSLALFLLKLLIRTFFRQKRYLYYSSCMVLKIESGLQEHAIQRVVNNSYITFYRVTNLFHFEREKSISRLNCWEHNLKKVYGLVSSLG